MTLIKISYSTLQDDLLNTYKAHPQLLDESQKITESEFKRITTAANNHLQYITHQKTDTFNAFLLVTTAFSPSFPYRSCFFSTIALCVKTIKTHLQLGKHWKHKQDDLDKPVEVLKNMSRNISTISRINNSSSIENYLKIGRAVVEMFEKLRKIALILTCAPKNATVEKVTGFRVLQALEAFLEKLENTQGYKNLEKFFAKHSSYPRRSKRQQI
ncbi:MAG: hypothetical protein AAGI90_02870 [Chlamydiota bacterium]